MTNDSVETSPKDLLVLANFVGECQTEPKVTGYVLLVSLNNLPWSSTLSDRQLQICWNFSNLSKIAETHWGYVSECGQHRSTVPGCLECFPADLLILANSSKKDPGDPKVTENMLLMSPNCFPPSKTVQNTSLRIYYLWWFLQTTSNRAENHWVFAPRTSEYILVATECKPTAFKI